VSGSINQVTKRHFVKRRKRLLELFPDHIVVGDRVLIIQGPQQNIVAEIVEQNRDIRYDLQKCEWNEQPVYKLKPIDPPGPVLAKWHSKNEVSYHPSEEEIRRKASLIRSLNDSELHER